MRIVSIVCACRNERSGLERFLRSLSAQARDGFELEAVLADGESEDGTRARLEEFARGRPWVQVIGNRGRIASTGLNAAVWASRGEVIVRMDAHTEYASDYVQQCVAALDETGAAAVGGPVRAGAGTYWQAATALAWRSGFFSGRSRVYDIGYRGRADSVPYGCWPREALERAGLFDEAMARNQDDELSLRIVGGGGLIWQAPQIRSWYWPRRSALAQGRQYFGYGQWKVYTMRKHQRMVHLRHAVPGTALAGLLLLAGAASVNRGARGWLGCGLAAYTAAALGSAAAAVNEWRETRLIPGAALAIAVAHVAYGAGTLWGMWRFRRYRMYESRTTAAVER